eukprot:scaffold2189_cov116-Cylindrotheca_fusiformis.AAC.16
MNPQNRRKWEITLWHPHAIMSERIPSALISPPHQQAGSWKGSPARSLHSFTLVTNSLFSRTTAGRLYGVSANSQRPVGSQKRRVCVLADK